MIAGAHNGNSFIVKHYEEKQYPEILKHYFASLEKKKLDV